MFGIDISRDNWDTVFVDGKKLQPGATKAVSITGRNYRLVTTLLGFNMDDPVVGPNGNCAKP